MRLTTSITTRHDKTIHDAALGAIYDSLEPLVTAGWDKEHSGLAESDSITFSAPGVSVKIISQGWRITCELGLARPLSKADEDAAHLHTIAALKPLLTKFNGLQFLLRVFSNRDAIGGVPCPS